MASVEIWAILAGRLDWLRERPPRTALAASDAAAFRHVERVMRSGVLANF